MARLPLDTSAGQSDSSTQSHTTILDANSGHSLTLPGHQYVTDAQMLRDGQDLILHPAHGNDVIVKNYFTADPAPVLTSADGGSALTHDLVDSFVKPIGGIQYAQNGSVDDVSPVGIVKEVTGEGTITHANGLVQKAAIGVPIFEGDIVETKAHGAVNITFVDKTTFAVSENAKMAIDQYVFDPSTQHGENNFSVLRGVFVFTSGLIGHADPDDVKITTPVGSIGIRGTTIMGTINPGGDSHVSVVEGAIVISNAAGETTLSQQFETVKLTGMNQPMTAEGVLTADTMAYNYTVLRTVSAPLFSTFDDMGKTDGQPAQDSAAPAQDAAPATDDAPAKNAAPDASAPMNKSDAADPAATDAPATLTQVTLDDTSASLESGFDNSAGLKIASIFSSDSGIAAAMNTTSVSPALSAPASAFIATSAPPAQAAAVTPAPVVSAPPATSTPAPGAGAGSSTPALPALTISINTIANPTVSIGGVVATITASITPGLVYSWTSPTDGSSNPLFNLTQDTSGNGTITLTSYGVTYFTNLTAGGNIAFSVYATLPDGRNATGSNNFHVPADYDLSLNDVITGGASGAVFIPSTGSGTQHGSALTALGDYNHDGRMDYAFVNNVASAGNLFIDDKLGNHYNINLASTAYNFTNTSKIVLASAGDFNGDGKGDLIIGGYLSDNNGQFSSGKVYILTNPDTGTGVNIIGMNSGNMAGFTVSGIGDYNGDGYNDVVIGAPYTSGSGSAYMLLGKAGNATIDVSNLTVEGFALSGGAGYASNVSGIGDFNHDGYSDFAVTDMTANRVTFFYGGQPGTNSGGMNISGLSTGATPKIVSLGDANGDGNTDFGIFDNVADKFYVFNGSSSRGNADFSVGTANYAFTANTGNIINVDSAGDFNGDGLNDFAIAIRNGSNLEVYVVYGSSTLSGTLDPSALSNAYHMHLDLTSGQFNLANPATDAVSISLSAAGDLNGDGYDDLLIGLPNIDKDGGGHTDDGGVIIVNGAASPGSITAGSNATASYQSLVGTDGVDTMSNGNTAITNTRFNAGAGNDSISLYGSNGASLIDGGTGMDTLHLMTGATLDLRNAQLSGLEKISLDANGQVLTLTLDQVFNLLHTSQDNTLHIDTAMSTTQFNIDTNKSGTTMTAAGFTDAGVSGNYHMYTQGSYTLYVDTSITTIAQNI